MQNMRRIREARGLTLIELEHMTGLSRYQLGRYENGHQDPSMQRGAKVARALGASLDDLVGLHDPEAMEPSTVRG